MAENSPETTEPEGKSIKTVVGDMFSNVKTPVFWFAAGYILCKFMDRKTKTV